ncbi:hypothetical protein PVT71_18025 [Salipiger sp. H15]|uniref:Uncharacterized protein n=1 Tax=Alloyangia sp. H15 TaxID=3029062 RepID=A0AAU8APS7_9RHOB
MNTPLLALSLLLALGATAAQADCYAEYKAKQDDPLRLQYGIALLPTETCPSKNTAAAQLEIRLDRNGWTLLSVVALSEKPPSEEKKKNAGEFYLRY